MIDTILIVVNISITLLAEIRKSRCTHIETPCFKLDREVEGIQHQPSPTVEMDTIK
jgi:hypothetical protein